MNDYAPYFRAKQQAEKDETEIAEMARRAAPLQWAVIAVVIAISLLFAADGLTAHLKRYAELAANNEALVACLNGHLIGVDNTLIGCEKHEIKLIAQGGEQ